MKRIKMLSTVMLMTIFILGSVASPYLGATAIANAATVTISSSAAKLEIGTSKKLTISGTTSKVSWYSNNKTVATVSSYGTVSAKALGTATITASVGSKKLTCYVTVIKPIKISYTSYTLPVGSTKKLLITGTTSKVTWTSSNKAIATVSSWGTITPVAAGKATITAKVDGKTLTCALTVLQISNKTYSLETGKTYKLKITGTTSTVTWSSSDKTIATVSSWGTVTGIKAGQTTITASVAGKKLTCLVTVTLPLNPYVTNAPFAAKEWNTATYSFVAPKDWVSYVSDVVDGTQTVSLTDNSIGSYVNIGIYKSDTAAPDYATAKETFLTELNEATVRQQYTDVFDQLGITDYSITDFAQGDFVSDSGNVFKTEFTINIMGTSMKQILYYYYIGNNMVEVSVTDMDGSLEATTDHIVNSFRLK